MANTSEDSLNAHNPNSTVNPTYINPQNIFKNFNLKKKEKSSETEIQIFVFF